MPKVSNLFKKEISSLSKADLEKLVIKAATINKQFYDYLTINYTNKENGENDLFEEAKRDLEFLFRKSYKGFSEELQLANMLAACNKRINEFGKVCKDKSFELELILFVLEIPFSVSPNHFTTCFTRYNYQVYLLVKKAITLLTVKLHEDYRIEYAAKLNVYLAILYSTSSHLDYIYVLPKTV